MNHLSLLLWMTFIESLATILVERGVYFFTQSQLGFSDPENLWLALAWGAAYAVGGLVSHRVSVRLKERPLLAATLVGQLFLNLLLAARPTRLMVYVAFAALAWVNGLKWPVIESYVSAGRTPAQTASAIGRFNVSWASAVPLGMAVAGPLIALLPAGLFLLPALLNLASLAMTPPLPRVPLHLPADHVDRPDAPSLRRMGGLLVCSRWLMLFSYAALYLLAALMPGIFAGLGYGVAAATPLAGLVDVVRVVAFVVMIRYTGWHNRVAPLLLSLLALPVGFVMVLSGANTTVVLAGEVIFGLVAGLVYYAALYYVMVLKNASVDAGGGHESLIGLGFAVGPASGIVGIALAPKLGSQFAGVLVGGTAVFAVCAVGSLWPILRRPPRRHSQV